MPNETKTSHQIDRFDLNAIYETSRLLSTSIDLEFVLNNLLLTAMSKLLVTRGVALLYEPVEGGYRVVAAKGAVGMASGELVLLDEEQRFDTFPKREVLRDDAVPEALRERRIRLVLPVASGDREIGLIGLGGKATGAPFERPELEFIQSLVQMSASAVHNSMMVRELQQANRDLDDKIQQLNTLFDLSQEFNATIDHNHLVKLLSFALMGQMGVRRFALVLRRTDMADGPVWDPIAHKGTAPEAFSDVPDEAYAKARELILLEETDVEVWTPLAEAGLTLALPLRQQNETTGVLCLGPKLSEASYTPEDVEFLYALGNLALVSIQNSFLVEEQIEKELGSPRHLQHRGRGIPSGGPESAARRVRPRRQGPPSCRHASAWRSLCAGPARAPCVPGTDAPGVRGDRPSRCAGNPHARTEARHTDVDAQG